MTKENFPPRRKSIKAQPMRIGAERTQIEGGLPSLPESFQAVIYQVAISRLAAWKMACKHSGKLL